MTKKNIDSIDLKILRILQDEGRISNLDLSKKIDDKVSYDLSVFLDNTKFTIGLRQQQKLPRDIALFLAGCKSDHRDLSLYF